MQGVVTFLDAKHSRLVKNLWAKWRRASGFSGLADLQYPHFSFHVAESYDAASISTALRRIARATPEFRVQASGLGFFTGKRKVLYIAIARSAQLDALRRRIVRAVRQSASQSGPFCEDREWIPHVTLAEGEIENRALASLLSQLSDGDFRWELRVRNLALLINERGRQAVKFRFPLAGEPTR